MAGRSIDPESPTSAAQAPTRAILRSVAVSIKALLCAWTRILDKAGCAVAFLPGTTLTINFNSRSKSAFFTSHFMTHL